MNRKKIRTVLLLVFLAAVAVLVGFRNPILCRIGYNPFLEWLGFGPKCYVPTIVSADDSGNGVPDALDLVVGAREEVSRRTSYDASYWQGGYPPEGKGACTDVVWRALAQAGYDLKNMVDEDIKTAPSAYTPQITCPDPNIDFRRVSNLVAFFSRNSRSLTTEVKPGDADNLVQWQPGDIVVFGAPNEHIAVISDRRRRDGVPLIIHNAGPQATESDGLLRWPSRITNHFRIHNDVERISRR